MRSARRRARSMPAAWSARLISARACGRKAAPSSVSLAPARGAVQQRRAQVGFQPGDPLGHGLLGHPQAVGRVGEMPVVDDGEEGPDRTEVQLHEQLLVVSDRRVGCWTALVTCRSNDRRQDLRTTPRSRS